MNATPAESGSRDARTLWLVVLLLTVYALGWANWHYPVLRFGHSRLNGMALALLLLLPSAALLFALRFTRIWQRVLCGIVILPFALYGLFFSVFAVGEAAAPSQYLDRQQTIPMGAYRVEVYPTNCGATCAYGILVRQERPILPGILLVRNVFGAYPALEAHCDVVGPDSLRVVIPSYSEDRPETAETETVHLRPLVYI